MGLAPGAKGTAGRTSARRSTRVLTVHHVRSDGEERLRGVRIAVTFVLTHVVHERLGDVHRNLVSSVVVVTEGHVAAFLFETDRQTTFVANHAHLTET